MPGPHFQPSLFKFLKDLKRNNNREWFKANKKRYEAELRDPCLAFIADFDARLRKISGHFVANPKPVGGSLFRIHRDTRFSKDKTPYKTAAGIHFRHEAAKDAYAPGFYLHLEPGECFFGAGIWHPDGPTLRGIRDALVSDPGRWKKVTGARAFRSTFELAGDSLKRVPRGFDPEHELAEDLRRKDFIVTAPFTQAQVCGGDFMKTFSATCRSAKPLVGFICDALELPV